MIYLASRYSDHSIEVMHNRFLTTQRVVAAMLMRKEFVYSPIVHCHELSVAYVLPRDFQFWQQYDFDMLRRADRLVVLNEFNVELSIGVTAEVKFARSFNLPIVYADAAMLLLETPK